MVRYVGAGFIKADQSGKPKPIIEFYSRYKKHYPKDLSHSSDKYTKTITKEQV